MYVLIYDRHGMTVEGPFPTREDAETYSREWYYMPELNKILKLLPPGA